MPALGTIAEAEEAIRRRFAADGFTYTGKEGIGKFDYDSSRVIENERWWFIPMGWIGCMGFIVNKNDHYVNWLGSGADINDVFWGHDHGIYCDMVDFTFYPETNLELAERIVRHFKTAARDSGVLCFYPDSEIPILLRKQFPTIKNHFAWYAIPEIQKASQKEGLQFSCALTKELNP